MFSKGNVTIINSNYYENHAKNNGGGINNYEGNLFINKTNFTENIADNMGGGISNRGSLTIKESNIIGNTAIYGGGIVNQNGTAIVNFNSFINNQPTAIQLEDGTININYNWWGSNNPNFSTLIKGNATTNQWIVLTEKSTPNMVNLGGNSTVTADLLHDNRGIYHNPMNGVVPYTGSASFSTNKGSIKKSNFSNGIATSTLTSLNTPGVTVVSSTVNNQTVFTNVTVKNTITISQLTSAAYDVKIYYEHNRTLPSEITIDSRIVLSQAQFLQLLVNATININRGILNPLQVSDVKTAPKPTGSYKAGKLYESEYLIVAQNIENFINNNKRAPNFATTNLGNIPFSKLIYMYSKILNYYGFHNQLPNYVSI